MKRTILVIAVIALVAVAVFGGQALAAKPSGSSVAMETIMGKVYASDIGDPVEVRETYPETRNVHLTFVLADTGDSRDGWAIVRTRIGLSLFDMSFLTMDEEGFYTCEFDTNEWYLEVSPPSSGQTHLRYEATITYPR
jgi:hypothetical protein